MSVLQRDSRLVSPQHCSAKPNFCCYQDFNFRDIKAENTVIHKLS